MRNRLYMVVPLDPEDDYYEGEPAGYFISKKQAQLFADYLEKEMLDVFGDIPKYAYKCKVSSTELYTNADQAITQHQQALRHVKESKNL